MKKITLVIYEIRMGGITSQQTIAVMERRKMEAIQLITTEVKKIVEKLTELQESKAIEDGRRWGE